MRKVTSSLAVCLLLLTANLSSGQKETKKNDASNQPAWAWYWHLLPSDKDFLEKLTHCDCGVFVRRDDAGLRLEAFEFDRLPDDTIKRTRQVIDISQDSRGCRTVKTWWEMTTETKAQVLTEGPDLFAKLCANGAHSLPAEVKRFFHGFNGIGPGLNPGRCREPQQ